MSRVGERVGDGSGLFELSWAAKPKSNGGTVLSDRLLGLGRWKVDLDVVLPPCEGPL